MIAPLLLLPMIENAFKHGVSRSANKAWLHCHIAVGNTDLDVTVDNSKQADDHRKTKGGIGLANLTRRLELLYAGKYEMKTYISDYVYETHLNIDLT